MATIKSFTDIKQSKKLAKFLPPESADMEYMFLKKDNSMVSRVPFVKDGTEEPDCPYNMIPCWSLAALLNLLPNEISTGERYCDKYQIDIRKYDGGDNTTFHQIAYGNDRGLSGSWHDMINTGERENLIDACVDMIIHLHELKML